MASRDAFSPAFVALHVLATWGGEAVTLWGIRSSVPFSDERVVSSVLIEWGKESWEDICSCTNLFYVTVRGPKDYIDPDNKGCHLHLTEFLS